MEQSWECTFLKVFTHMNTKWASKKDFIIGLQNYKLACMADPANQGWIGRKLYLVVLKSNDEIFFWCSLCIYMGKEFQKSALPTLFHFVWVSAALQPHVFHVCFWKFPWHNWACLMLETSAAEATLAFLSTIACFKYLSLHWSINGSFVTQQRALIADALKLNNYEKCKYHL